MIKNAAIERDKGPRDRNNTKLYPSPFAVMVAFGVATLSWLIVYPGLTALLEQAKIGETLSRMLG